MTQILDILTGFSDSTASKVDGVIPVVAAPRIESALSTATPLSRSLLSRRLRSRTDRLAELRERAAARRRAMPWGDDPGLMEVDREEMTRLQASSSAWQDEA